MSIFSLLSSPTLLHLSISLSLAYLLSLLHLPIFLLHSLHSYIHPDHVPNNGVKAAIRRPSDNPQPRSKSKKNPDLFDEQNAQIFRIKLDGPHLVSRVFFKEYRDGLNLFLLFGLCLLGNLMLKGVLGNGVFVCVLLGVLCVVKLVVVLGKVCFEVSASKRLDKQSSFVVGVVGFGIGMGIFSEGVRRWFGFEFGEFDGFGRILVAGMMGLFVGLLYMPAGRAARAFWIGTDQVRGDLSIISCGWFARTVLYLNCVLTVFTTLLWISPFAEMLVNDGIRSGKVGSGVQRVRGAEKLIGNMGMSREDFANFRLWCLLLWGVLQIVALRSNLQMFLNEAVLCWYQRLHASKVPDLEFSRAKVFLQNHFLCLGVIQFFAPPALVLVFLGLSQVDSLPLKNFSLISSLVTDFDFFKDIALFMAWWIVFIWAIFTSANLVLYRRGILYVS